MGTYGLDEAQYSVPLKSVQVSADIIYLEVDDLLDYLRNHKTLSGIQRVQVGVIQYALDEINRGDASYAFIRTGKHGSGFWSLAPDDLSAITDYISQPVVSQQQLLSIIEFAEQHASRVEPAAGQTYFVLGAFWDSVRTLPDTQG